MRLPFSARFALVLVVLGGLIAGATVAVPLAEAQTQRRQSALDRAADRLALALDLVRAEEGSLQGFAAAAVRQLPGAVGQDFVIRLSAATQVDDVVALLAPGGPLVARDGSAAPAPVAALARAAATVREPVVASPDGQPWLLGRAESPVGPLLVLRPLRASVLSAVSRDAGGVPEAGLAVVRGGRVSIPGSIAGHRADAGERLPAAIGGITASGGAAAIAPIDGGDVAAAQAGLGGGYTLVVTGAVEGGLASAITLPVVVIATALILLALVVVFGLVQHDLQGPLSRLDRAVAALADEDFDHPVPAEGDSSVARLGAHFEAMRRDLAATLRSTQARAAIATDLGTATPLQTALDMVCQRLARATGAAALIVVHDEMAEELCSAGIGSPPPPGRLLRGDGPLAAAARLDGYQPLIACALAESPDAEAGLRVVCAAPLRVGSAAHGVIALADREAGFGRNEQELLAVAAEQVSLAIERDRVLAAARLQASTDALTGLSNRRFARAYLEQQIAVSDRSRQPFSVMMIDVDEFKKINDSLGHDVGDAALVAVARSIESTLRRSDLAARYGGDEFLVVMSETAAQDAELVAEKLRSAVNQLRVSLEPPLPGPRVTISIGVAGRVPRGAGVDRVLLLADNALYEAKRAGRDRVRVAPADASEEVAAGSSD